MSLNRTAASNSLPKKEIYEVGDRVKFGTDDTGDSNLYTGTIMRRELPTKYDSYYILVDSNPRFEPATMFEVKSDEITGLLKTSGGKRKRQTKGQRRRRTTRRR